jgi:hypothetical protein
MTKMWVRGSRNLDLRTTWPSGSDAVASLDGWLGRHEATRVVFIDTLQRIADWQDANSYRETYATGVGLKKVADKHGVAIVVIHHTSKGIATDFVHSVNGSVGLTGSADTVITMRRPRMEVDGVLSVTGRDVEEQERGIHFDAGIGTWTLMDHVPKEKKWRKREDAADGKAAAAGDA